MFWGHAILLLGSHKFKFFVIGQFLLEANFQKYVKCLLGLGTEEDN